MYRMGRAILKAERESLTSIRGGACQLPGDQGDITGEG